jgi:hypothetical protein
MSQDLPVLSRRKSPETSSPEYYFHVPISRIFPAGSSEIRSFPEAGIIDLGIGYSQKKLLLSSLT